MSELATVESRKDRVIRHFRGARIARVTVLDDRGLRGTTASELRDVLANARLVDVERRGLNLIFRTDRGRSLVLEMNEDADVQWVVPPITERPKHAAIVFEFEDGRELVVIMPSFRDKFFFFRSDDVLSAPPLANLGPEVRDLSYMEFRERLQTYPDRAIFENLIDQTLMTGLGPEYADEICFRAGIRPDRKVSELMREDWERLYDETMCVLDTMLEYDADPWAHEKLGILIPNRGTDKGCPECKGPLKVVTFGRVRSYYCPVCQNGERGERKLWKYR